MKTISIVVPAYNESAVLNSFANEVRPTVDRLASRYAVRLIFVDDGSRDDTWRIIQDLSKQDDRISGLRLSRNFGHQAALSCGYELAPGDAVVSMDADLQDPPSVLLEMVAQWEGGSRVVLAVRKERRGESRAKRWTAEMYYRLLSWIAESNTVRESGDFRLLDRTVVDAFNRLPERHRYIRGLIGWLGFRTSVVEYVRPERRAGETKYPVWKMVRLAMDGIVSLSFMPLRAAYLVALAMMVPFLGYLLYNAVLYYFYQVQMVPGWSSLLLAITLFGAANLLMLGILGEYAGRIYSEVKRRPIFLVEDSCGTVEGLHECR